MKGRRLLVTGFAESWVDLAGCRQLLGCAVPYKESKVSGSHGSMWPVVVLGILTAIFAWVWYSGSGEAKEPETPVQKEETQQENAESEHRPLAADEPKSSERKAPSLETQEKNPDIYQPKLQVTEPRLSDADCHESELEVQSNAADNANVTHGNIKEHPTDLPSKGELQADIQEPPTDLPKKGKSQADIQEHPTDLPKKGKSQADIQEHPTDLPKKGKSQADIQEHPTDLPRKGEPQDDIQEPPTDLPRKGELQDNIQEHPTDLPKKGKSQADIQEPPTDIPNKDNQANILEHQTCLLEEQFIVQTNAKKNYKEITSKNDEVDVHPSDITEAKDQVYPPLEKGVQSSGEEGYPHDLGTAVVQANGEDMCPVLIAEEPAAQKLLGDTCHGSMSQYKDGHLVCDREEGVCANGEVNEAKQTEENATDHPLENSFCVKENVMNVWESKEPLNQDLFLELVNKSIDDAYAIVANQLKPESVEKCDIKRESMCSDTLKSPPSLQDDNSTLEGLSNLGTNPESSPVDMCHLMSNQEREMASFSSSNTDEKTSFGSPSEASIQETDHQKPRKVATIHPMSQNVNFAFKVHYITHSDSQIIGITGDHEKLGKWETYVPLSSGNGGFWSHSIALPADTNLAWKLVMVENGKIKRWEECNNRSLKTAHEDIETHLSWGYP